MSILSDLFGGIFDADGDNTQTSASGTHPCANCPSDCTIAGAACDVCSPYKKKLIDAVYYIDHLDEFKAQYEVTGLTGAASAITCPYCGAQTQNHMVCEYCGSKLSEESGKIKVSSASEIPNPIMQAQDIIFERYETVIKQYASLSQNSDNKGILEEILSAITGDDDDNANALGAKMSEAEIREAASLYGVSVSDYLTGLDNGKYLTLAGRKAAASSGLGDTIAPAATGITGLAGIGLFANQLLNNNSYYNRPGYYGRPPHNEPPHHSEPPHYTGHNRPQSPSRDERRDNMRDTRRDSRVENRHDNRTDDRRRNEPSQRRDQSHNRSDRNHGGPGSRR